jgi:streptogramin lyase
MNFKDLRFLSFAACILCCAQPIALANSVAAITPGDVIFTEFFNGWHKLDPATGVVTALPWPAYSVFTEYLEFDVDGAILFDDFGDQIKRLNPASNAVHNLNVPGASSIDGFVVEPNGDLLIANGGDVSRFSRASETTSIVTSDSFFAPRGIARGDDGRVFVTEFFDGLWEIDANASAKSLVTNFEFSIPGLIAVQSDGDLIVENFSPSVLYEIDPETGSVVLYSDDVPTFVRDMAVDPDDNLWLTSTDGIFRYSPTGGTPTLVASGTFFSPRAVAIVPQNWTMPPVPEPTSIHIAICAAGVFGFFARSMRGSFIA